MPWSNNNGGPKSSGPWGSGGGGGGGGGPWGGGGQGGGGPRGGGGGGGGQGPNIDDFFKKGQNQLKNVLGDGGGGSSWSGLIFVLLFAAAGWTYLSVFQVKPEEQAVVLQFGKFDRVVGSGLNFAPWPIYTFEKRAVTTENTVEIGQSRGAATSSRAGGRNAGLMLTGDENIIDVNYQVVWNIKDIEMFVFNIADAEATIEAVGESAMREVIGRSQLAPLLNRDRALLGEQVKDLIQLTLDEYESGVNIVRVNLDRADPPPEVIDAFRDVQAAEQERDTKLKQAEAYYNRRTAEARGEAAQIFEQAEAYRAQVVNEAEGDAARFNSVYEEYAVAQEVTRKRLYIETMERVFGGMNKIIIDKDSGPNGDGIVPYLPLDQLQRRSTPSQ